MIGSEKTPVAVAVIGAGPAGSAAALRLAARGVGPVLLAEASRFEDERIGESVPPDFRDLLTELDLLEAFLQEGHLRCLGSASSWGAAKLGYNDFMAHPRGSGWHLDRTRFDQFMAHAAAARGADLRLGWRLVATTPSPGGGGYGLSFQAADGRRREVAAQMVIDATGRRARFARFAGGARRRITDRLVCVAGRFVAGSSTGVGQSTWLEAVEHGWWYAAGLPGGRILVAMAADPATCTRAKLTDPERWLGRLAHTRHLATRLHGGLLDPRSLAVHAAPSFRLDPMHGADWVAVGDAACSFDPLTSQGIYQGVASGLAAADAIAGRRAGREARLRDYAQTRRRAYAEYRRLHGHLYGLERRWPDSPFWRRRQRAVAKDSPSVTRAAVPRE